VYPRNGRLDFADVRISPATGTQEARAQVPNPEGRLRPGQFVRVVLRGGVRPQALTVPQRAVLEGPQGKFVYVVNGKSQAEPRPVELGDWWGNEWIVNSGLEGGEQVIVEGVMKLGPGAPVKVAQPKAEAK
jgi:membrane fusion protein, multidrug efflux system